MTLRPILIAALFVLCCPTCGGGGYSVGDRWDEREARFFDDGIDLIEDPDSATGIFGFHQKDLLEGRIQLSDFIAVVNVQTVRTSTTVDRIEIKHIDVTIEKKLYGNRPEKRVSLRSEPSTRGYALIRRHEASLSGRFILFSRWFEDKTKSTATPEIAYHFHLTPASPFMLAEVKHRLALRVQLEKQQ